MLKECPRIWKETLAPRVLIMQNFAPRPPEKAGWHNISKDDSGFRSWLLHFHFLWEASVDTAAPSSHPPKYTNLLCAPRACHTSLFFYIPLFLQLAHSIRIACLSVYVHWMINARKAETIYIVLSVLSQASNYSVWWTVYPHYMFVEWIKSTFFKAVALLSFLYFFISSLSSRSLPALRVLRKAFSEPAFGIRLPCLCFPVVQYISHCMFHPCSFAAGCMMVPLMPVAPIWM